MKDFNLAQLDSVISGENSLILFYADWCYYCKSFIPIFENAVKDYTNDDLSYKD